jgi:hypothetical protein
MIHSEHTEAEAAAAKVAGHVATAKTASIRMVAAAMTWAEKATTEAEKAKAVKAIGIGKEAYATFAKMYREMT